MPLIVFVTVPLPNSEPMFTDTPRFAVKSVAVIPPCTFTFTKLQFCAVPVTRAMLSTLFTTKVFSLSSLMLTFSNVDPRLSWASRPTLVISVSFASPLITGLKSNTKLTFNSLNPSR